MEEDIKILEKFKKYGYHTLMMEYGSRNKTNLKLERAIENLINRNKELEEENEELKREKVDNSKIILLAQSGMLDYQKGYEDGKARRMSAVQNIVENQQYYIFKKQFERYEKRIDELEEKNKELKNLANNTQWISPCYVAQNYIPKSKITKKIKELKQENLEIYDTDIENLIIAKYEQRAILDFLEELLQEGE